jgi:di/tricarboxylate transporter
MSPELISIYALAAMFVIATLLPINMGVLAFVGAFLVGTLVAGQATKEIIAGFPTGLFLTLVGITYLFALAQNNGTIDWLVQLAVRAVRGHVAAIPWIMFFIAAVLTSVGAVSPAAVAIIAPIALGFAIQHRPAASRRSASMAGSPTASSPRLACRSARSRPSWQASSSISRWRRCFSS